MINVRDNRDISKILNHFLTLNLWWHVGGGAARGLYHSQRRCSSGNSAATPQPIALFISVKSLAKLHYISAVFFLAH